MQGCSRTSANQPHPATPQAVEDPAAPVAFPFQTVAVESEVRGGVGWVAGSWEWSRHLHARKPPLAPPPTRLQADLLAMRKSLGGMVAYFERDGLAIVDNVPSLTIELPADMATIDAAAPWG